MTPESDSQKKPFNPDAWHRVRGFDVPTADWNAWKWAVQLRGMRWDDFFIQGVRRAGDGGSGTRWRDFFCAGMRMVVIDIVKGEIDRGKNPPQWVVEWMRGEN